MIKNADGAWRYVKLMLAIDGKDGTSGKYNLTDTVNREKGVGVEEVVEVIDVIEKAKTPKANTAAATGKSKKKHKKKKKGKKSTKSRKH